jgi:hypothetical protein
MRRRPMQSLRSVGKRAPLGLTCSRALLAAALTSFVLPIVVPGSAAAIDPITYTVNCIQGTNGWYRGSSLGNFVRVYWSINVDVLQGCPSPVKVDGPATGAIASCTVTLTNGTPLTWKTGVIKIDANPPTGVAASSTRAPDFNGWYNHPVQVTWTGSDSISGLAGCSSVNFSGPDGASASVTGGCTDNAGNTATIPIAINYDATAPTLSKVEVTSRAASALVKWQSTSPADTIVVHRSARGNKADPTVFRGAASSFADKKIHRGLEYVYSLQSYDQAGNASKIVSAVALPKVLTLRKTPYTPRAAANPVLRWDAVRGATYYHVQLFRGKKRILAAWPSTNQLELPAAWRWAGHRYKLGPARYRWYVWEGIGKRSFARYRTLGSAAFIVPKR